MNHDISHCAGSKCPVRNDCLRYTAHLDLVRQKKRKAHACWYASYIPDDLCRDKDLFINNKNN